MTATNRKRASFGEWVKRHTVSSIGYKKSTYKDVQSSPVSLRKGVFSVPLSESICYARATVGYVDEQAVKHQHAGLIPLVVAKTGYYLKSNALHTEGIFRRNGNLKRINTIQAIFDDPSLSFGLHVNWHECTPHDVASVLRRYLNKLPEPVIPHKFYKDFRDVMSDKYQRTTEERVSAFQELIQRLPIPHQHLLLYLLDLLCLFASHADENKMNASNLAIVFAPAILSHPSHNTPVEYKVSQRVLEFLIEFQAMFTMQLLFRNKSAAQSPSPPSHPPLAMPLPKTIPKPIVLRHIPHGEKHSPSNLPESSPEDVYLASPQPQPLSPVSKPNYASDHDSAYSADSHNDVCTVRKSSFSLHTENGVLLANENDNGIALPPSRACSHAPLSPVVTHATSSNDGQSIGWLQRECRTIGNVLQELGHTRGGKPLSFWGFVATITTVVAIVVYEAYEAVWGAHGLQSYIFLAGFILYWVMLARGIGWHAMPVKETPLEVQEEPMEEPMEEPEEEPEEEPADDQVDEDEGLSLFEDISVAQDQTLEEIMLRDAKCEWHSLLTRSWRAEFPDTDDTSEMISIISMASRFNEEVNYGGQSENEDQGDGDEDYDPLMDIGETELEEMLQRYQQIQSDAALATRMQQEEKQVTQERDNAINPFVEPPMSKEDQKIRYF